MPITGNTSNVNQNIEAWSRIILHQSCLSHIIFSVFVWRDLFLGFQPKWQIRFWEIVDIIGSCIRKWKKDQLAGWNEVCKPKSEGGSGIRKITLKNMTDVLWHKIILAIYGPNSNGWDANVIVRSSHWFLGSPVHNFSLSLLISLTIKQEWYWNLVLGRYLVEWLIFLRPISKSL